MEYEVNYDDALKLLQGYQSSGATHPHFPQTAERRDIPVKPRVRPESIADHPVRQGGSQPPGQGVSSQAAASSQASEAATAVASGLSKQSIMV